MSAVGALAISLSLALLACQIDVGGPAAPGEPIAASDQSASEVAQIWQGALTAALRTGQLTVLFDEQQLTSYFAARAGAREESFLQEPQVYLRDGLIQIHGVTRQGALQASVLITVAPRLDPEGGLTFELTSADFGPLPVPDAVRASISTILTEALTTPLGSLAPGVRITSVAIADGQMALVGELR